MAQRPARVLSRNETGRRMKPEETPEAMGERLRAEWMAGEAARAAKSARNAKRRAAHAVKHPVTVAANQSSRGHDDFDAPHWWNR